MSLSLHMTRQAKGEAAIKPATPWCVLVVGTAIRFENARHQDGTIG